VIILSLAFFGDEVSIEVTIRVMHTVQSRFYILHVPYCLLFSAQHLTNGEVANKNQYILHSKKKKKVSRKTE